MIVMRVTDEDSVDPRQLLAGERGMKQTSKQTVFLMLRDNKSDLFHGAGGSSVPFGPHELNWTGSLTKNGVCQNIHALHLNQNRGVAEPSDSQTWMRV